MEKYIKDFVDNIKGPFKKQENCKGVYTSKYIINNNEGYEDIYNIAVYQAYLDVCRTMHGAGKSAKKSSIEEARKSMADELKTYFEGKPKTKQDDFENWHEKTCNEFERKTGCNKGQSQKILNMAFKYLYCCDDIRREKSSYFDRCHMPLDSYILNWYKDACDNSYNGGSWSKMDTILYDEIQGNIRNKLESKSVLCCEFEIWQKEKEKIEKVKIIKCAESIKESECCSSELRKLLEAFIDDIKRMGENQND